MEQMQPTTPAPKDNRNLIYGLLTGALILSWAWFFYSQKQSTDTQNTLTAQKEVVTTELEDVKQLYEASLFRLDSLMDENTALNESLTSSNSEIAKMKMEIGKILNKKNATAAELAKARKMIGEMNGKIANLAVEVDRLKGENAELTATNTRISEEKQQVEQNLAATSAQKKQVEDELTNTKDVASTLKASNINIVAINQRASGKEKETTKAKRADKLRINFTIDDNRIAQPGPKELFVVITDPTGKVVTYSNEDVLITRDGGSQPFTAKVSVNYEGGKSMPVSFDWKNDKDFAEGNYKITIFNNGFKIGESVRSLKKGGLF